MSRVSAAPSRLRVELALGAIVGTGAFLAVRSASFGGDAVLLALVVWGYLLGYVAVHLDRNRSPTTGVVRRRLGAANWVTLFRGWLLAALAGVAPVATSTWLLAGIFVLASVLDAADGAIARRTCRTDLGERLDGTTDGLAVLVGGAAGVAVGVLPAWYLVAGAAWYLYAGSLWYRSLAGRRVYELPDSRVRSVVGAGQLVLIGGALLPAFGPPETTIAAAVALVSLLGSFARDWAVATGRIGGIATVRADRGPRGR